MKTSPLWVERIPRHRETPVVVATETVEAKAFVALLREVAKAFSTRDVVKEYSVCQCFPVQGGWSVASWADEDKWIKGIPMPNFATSFGIGRNGTFFIKWQQKTNEIQIQILVSNCGGK